MGNNSQPTYKDRRLPPSNVYDNIDDIRWHFLFGGLFVAERPIDPDSQPTYEQGEPDEPDSDSEMEGESQNIDEAGDTTGTGDVNPDLDDADGESDFDSDADTDSEPDHDSADNDGDEPDWADDDFDPDEDIDIEGDGIDPNDYGFDKPADIPPDLPGYETIAHPGGTVDHIRTFDSWVEFIQCASDLSLRAWKQSYHICLDKKEDPGGDYFATETLDQAISMAMWTGWPEGRDMLIDSLAAVMPTNEYRIHHELDVAGSFPIVPVYCAGDPACMMSIETEQLHQTRPIVRIDYNNMCSFLITPKAMMNMGAAVLSFAQSLEIAGFSTELRVIGNTSVGKNNFRYNVTYKRAGEPLDLDRAAFAIAHPSTMRRFALGLLEQHKDLEHFGENGHGYPLRISNDPTSGKPGGAIYIPPAARNYKEVSECTKIVEEAAQDIIRQITKVQEAAD